MIDKLFESVYNLFEEDEEKVNYERSDVEISPVIYSVELYINDKPQEDYYEKFENKNEAIEYGRKLLGMIGKDGEFTVQVLSYNTESGKIKVEWRETNQKWGEGFFEADENDEMKSILESTGYYDELSDIHNTGLAGNYDKTLEKVSKEDYKELKDEKWVKSLSEDYMSDKDIAKQYSDFEVINIDRKPSGKSGWVEISFPNADDVDFDSSIITDFIIYNHNGKVAFGDWFPNEVAEKLAKIVKDECSKPLNEDTEKQNGKWVNKGKEGTHGTFKTKKEADAQRKAMFANGHKC